MEKIRTTDSPDWKSIYDFVLECGKAQDPVSFASEVITHMKKICPFEEALVYFFDGNGKICNQHLHNIAENYSDTYVKYYAYENSELHNCRKENYREIPNKTMMKIIDWTSEDTLFVKNLIRPRGLRYTLAFLLYDLDRNYRTIYAFDRLRMNQFTEQEMTNVYHALPLLNNYHKKFFYTSRNLSVMPQFTTETSNLTVREAEIANMLCQGISPANISKTLFISTATTYKHIANIYEKMHVSSQRELLALLLKQPVNPA